MVGVLDKSARDAAQVKPLAELNLPKSAYELINMQRQQNGENIAIRYIAEGSAFAADKTPAPLGAERHLTYTDLGDQVTQCANALADLGHGSQPAIGMVLPNLPEAHITLWAGSTAGRVCPVNYMLEGRMIGGILNAAGASILVISGATPQGDLAAEKLDDILAAAPTIKYVLVVGEETPAAREDGIACWNFADKIATYKADTLAFDHDDAADRICAMFHTGGTTGFPKMAQHTNSNHVFTAWALATWFGFDQGTTNLSGLPLFHCNASIASGLSTLSVGGTIFLAGMHGYRSPGIVENFFRLVDHFKPVMFSAVPTIYSMLVQMDVGDADISSLRYAACGAAPMPVALFNRFEEKFGLKIIEGYGLTEATVTTSLNPLKPGEQRIGSIGISMPYVRMMVADLDAHGHFLGETAKGTQGDVLIAGPTVTPGYTDTSKNAALFVTDKNGDIWLNSGDRGYEDDDGYFWLTGRSKELIIRGGHNIDPKIIEEVLAQHPAVNLAAAIGRPDSYAGEVPVAYVQLSGEASEDELLAYCKENIDERAAVPKFVKIIADMPLTTVGKIHKPSLKTLDIKALVELQLTAFDTELSGAEVSISEQTTGKTVVIISATPASGADSASLSTKITAMFDDFNFDVEVKI